MGAHIRPHTTTRGGRANGRPGDVPRRARGPRGGRLPYSLVPRALLLLSNPVAALLRGFMVLGSRNPNIHVQTQLGSPIQTQGFSDSPYGAPATTDIALPIALIELQARVRDVEDRRLERGDRRGSNPRPSEPQSL
jgi:hypothetical protein